MENRITSMHDLANLCIEQMMFKPQYKRNQLPECYEHLIAMAKNDKISIEAISNMHNQVGKMLEGLKRRQ